MSITPVGGYAAYGLTTARGAGLPEAPGPQPASGSGESAFASIVSNLVTEVRSTGDAAELEAAKTVAGKGDLVKTAAAVNAAELALDTLVSVRDRMVNAYNDVMRMQI